MHPTRALPRFAIMLLCSALAACVATPPTQPSAGAGSPTVAATTVAMPNATGLLAQRLRQSLAQRGWTMSRYDAAALAKNRGYRRLAQRARYRLTLSDERIGDCRGGDPSFLYNMALIENGTGHVALALTGATCLNTAIAHFEADLDRKKLVVPTSTARNTR